VIRLGILRDLFVHIAIGWCFLPLVFFPFGFFYSSLLSVCEYFGPSICCSFAAYEYVPCMDVSFCFFYFCCFSFYWGISFGEITVLQINSRLVYESMIFRSRDLLIRDQQHIC
jgi:hypothetical protein